MLQLCLWHPRPGRLAWLVWPWRTEQSPPRCSGQPWGAACWRPLPSAGLSCAPAPQRGHRRGPSPLASRRAPVGLAPSQCTLPWGLQRGRPRGPRPPCPRPAFAEAPTCSLVSHLSWAAGGPVLGIHQACLAPKLLPGPAQPPPLPTEGAGRGQNPTSQVLSAWAQGRLLRLGMFLWCNENMTLIPRLFHVTYNYPQDVLLSSPYGCRLCRDVRRAANAGASPPLPRLTLPPPGLLQPSGVLSPRPWARRGGG